MGLLEPRKRKSDARIIDSELNFTSSDQNVLLTTEQRLLNELHEVEIKPARTVLCVERHQRSEVGYLSSDTEACEWGKTRENATTCGDCPFGVKLMEPVPKNDAKTILRNLRREQDDSKNIFQ